MANTSDVLQILYDNVDALTPTSIGGHSIAINLPNRPNNTTGDISIEPILSMSEVDVALAGTQRLEGTYEVGIFLPKNSGVLIGYQLGDIIKNGLAKNSFVNDNTRVTTSDAIISESGQAEDLDYYEMLVSIPFKTSRVSS